MKTVIYLLSVAILSSLISPAAYSQKRPYSWTDKHNSRDTVKNRIAVPRGYRRVDVSPESFGYWLRHLPLKEASTSVFLFNGRKKSNQSAHFAVIDIDIGKRDLQQCADAVIRLRAEFLFSAKNHEKIRFKFTSGHMASYEKWTQGYRPIVKGLSVKWQQKAKTDVSYSGFRNYLNTVFMYAGTYSLNKELK